MQLSHSYQENIVFRSIQAPSRKLLVPLLHYSPEKIQKQISRPQIRKRSSTSFESRNPIINNQSKKKYSLNKSININSNVEPRQKNFIPSQAKIFSEMVKKKSKLLKLKHGIKNQNQNKIPDILEIKQSVHEAQANFLRRMDVKLNSDGHANLLANLKKDLQIVSHNYLKEIQLKNKKNRRYLKKVESQSSQSLITIHYKFPTKQKYILQ